MNLQTLYECKKTIAPIITDIYCTQRKKPNISVPVVYNYVHNILKDTSAPTVLSEFIDWISENQKQYYIENIYGLDAHTWRILYGSFVSVDVQFEIEQNLLNCCHTAFVIHDMNVKLQIYHNNKESSKCISSCVQEVANAIRLIHSINKKYGNDKAPSSLQLNIWRSDKKKIFPKIREQHITCKHVNSGSTTFSFGAPFVIDIWRKEELLKVVIHELIHFFQWDFFCERRHTNLIRNHYCFTENTRLTINESYTEMMAVIIYSILISPDIKKTKYAINKQIGYCYSRSVLILKHYRITVEDLFTKNKCIDLISDVFSYHIMKVALLRRYKDIFKWLNSSVKICNTDKEIQEYQTILISSLKDEQFKTELAACYKKTNYFCNKKSLRMTK